MEPEKTEPEENNGSLNQSERAEMRQIVLEAAEPPRPISFFRLGIYNFFFILLTLHGPYMFLYMLPNLVLTPQGLEYDMGGIFPHLGASIAILGFQGILALGLTLLICTIRWLYRRVDAFTASFLSLCGLQPLVYYQVYFKTDPAILAVMMPFRISLLFLALFAAGSLFYLRFRKTA